MNENQDRNVSSFRKTWDILSPAVYYYVIYNVAVIILAFITGSVINTFYSEQIQNLMEHNTTISSLLSAIAMIIGIIPLIPGLKSQLYRNKTLNPGKKPGALQYIITVVIACAASIGLNILIILTGFVETSDAYRQVAERQYGVAFGIGLVLYGIISPVTEEIIFRGLIFNRMKKYYPIRLAIIASAAFFGIWHGNTVQAIYGTCMGLLLAYTYEKFKSFLIPCIFHAVANISVYTVTYNTKIYTAIVKPYVCIILLIISAAVILYLNRQTINGIDTQKHNKQ
ncbi:MAG: CPBP family intramembrane metalloprotease [Lachnospiraceae bacterium]|nr:CPBP family intramembrane metalloprotease [Lachnospiraceae bacterium]